MSTSIDQQFVEFVIKSLVSKPDAVVVERRIDEKGVLLELTVDPEDLGRVIGKRGATAQSIRTLLRALGTKNDARYNLKIIDNGPERPARQDDGTSQPQQPQPQASSSSQGQSGGLWGDDDGSNDDKADDKSVEAVEELAAQIDNDPKNSSAETPVDNNNDFNKVEEKQEKPKAEDEEDSWSKTRKELADLDDLDV